MDGYGCSLHVQSESSSCRLSIMPLRSGNDGGHGQADVRVLQRKRDART